MKRSNKICVFEDPQYLPATSSSPLDKQLQGACLVARQAVREGETQIAVIPRWADRD